MISSKGKLLLYLSYLIDEVLDESFRVFLMLVFYQRISRSNFKPETRGEQEITSKYDALIELLYMTFSTCELLLFNKDGLIMIVSSHISSYRFAPGAFNFTIVFKIQPH